MLFRFLIGVGIGTGLGLLLFDPDSDPVAPTIGLKDKNEDLYSDAERSMLLAEVLKRLQVRGCAIIE